MRLRILPVVVLALALAVSACGGGGGSKAAAATSTTSSTVPGNAAFQAYRDCLKQHGVNLPDNVGGPSGASGARRRPQGGSGPSGASGPSGPSGQADGGPPRTLPPGVDQQTFDAANQACASVRPQGGFGGGGGGGGARNNPAYVSCLADHGVTTTTTAPGAQPGRPFDRNDPKFASANEACQVLLPSTTTTTAAANS